MNCTQAYSHYFHFPKGKSKEYSDLRNYITNKYGNITTILLLVFIVSIPAYNYMVVKNYRSKFHYLRSFNSNLNHYILHQHHPNCVTASWKDKLLTTVAATTKAIAFKILLHYSTIVQLSFWICFLTSLSLIDIYHGDLISSNRFVSHIKTFTFAKHTLFDTYPHSQMAKPVDNSPSCDSHVDISCIFQ